MSDHGIIFSAQYLGGKKKKKKERKPSGFLFVVGTISALFMRRRKDAWKKLMTSIARSRANIVRNFGGGK